MKKIRKLSVVLVLSLQIAAAAPTAVLANEIQEAAESVQQSAEDAEVEESSEIVTESSTSLSNENSTQSTSESSTQQSSESSTRPSSESEDSTESSSSTSEGIESNKPGDQDTAKKEEDISLRPSESANQIIQEQPKQQAPVPEEAISNGFSPAVLPSNDNQAGKLHFEKDESVESFIRKIGESARKIGEEKDLYASVMIAQAILESGSGQSQLAQAPNYNLFGIKGTYNGQTISLATQEDGGDGTLFAVQSEFRVYKNYEESFEDYANLIKEGISGDNAYYAGTWKSNTKTYQDATKYLTGRYATDIQYNLKLNGLIETYELTEYDKAAQAVPVSSAGYKVPLNNYSISSFFGDRGGEFHRGLDMAASQGEPINASRSGVVLKAEYHDSWGNYVVIEHEDGWSTLYAHQQQYVVQVGEQVAQGQTIGYVGSTGNSTGPHLHFELCQDRSFSQALLIDPQGVLFSQ